MSPIQGLLTLFLLSLCAKLPRYSLVKGAVPAVNGHETAVESRLRGWHNKKEVDSAVPPKNSDHISSRKHQTASNGLESSSNSQQEESTIRLAISSTTVHTRQVEEADVMQCGDNQSLFRVEITTDYIPLQTSWELKDVSSNTVVMVAGSFDTGGSIYVETKCLESNLSCYQFTIKDFGANGICCEYGPGSYKVEYDNQLIKESEGNFGFKEDSELFGDTYACMSVLSSTPTIFPSAHPTNSQKPTTFPSRMPSAHPTNSQKPTAFPSRMPSAHPTNSQKPTTFPSRIPSSTPSLSFEPTLSPTDFQGFISYGYDTWNRRIFPSPLLREDMSKDSIASYHTWPNCSAAASIDADRFVGCVSIPKSSSVFLASPSWAGTLHSGKAPICKRGKCDLQIPMSNNALRIDTARANLGQVFQSKANIVEFLSSDLKSSAIRVVTVADVNVDGWPDIIIGNEGEPNQLLMNQGNGEFKEVAGALPHEQHPSVTRAIGVGDMNNDGFPDLIIGNDYQENTLLLNQGDGTFVYAPSVIPGGGSLPTWQIFIADINSDGHLDVIALHFSSGTRVQVLLNQGDSSTSTTFEDVTGDAISSDTSSTAITSMAVADVNGDGHTDIIIGNDLTEPNKVLLNLGNATFVELEGSIPNTSASSYSTLQIAVADLDGDGTIDLVVGYASNNHNPIQILLNQGNGTFEEGEVVMPAGGGVRFYSRTLAVADMDGDGRLDILIGTWDAFPNYLLQNQGSGRFGIVEGAFDESEDGKEDTTIAVSDVNGDGRIDVIIGNYKSDIQVLLNKEDGAYLEVLDAIPGSDNALDIAVADLDGDGLPDLVIGNGSKPNQVVLNQGDGTFEEKISDASSRESNTRAVAVGDLNGDGLPDIVMGNQNGMNQLMLNQGGGVFTESDLFSPGGVDYDVTHALALADLNGDGYLDILVGNLNYPNQLLLNRGDGTFEEVDGAIPGGFDINTFTIAVADFNNDGLIDIVIGNYEANQLLLNQGDGTFQEIEGAIPVENFDTRSIVVADVNGDGHIDIIVGNYGGPNQLLFNRGNATFEEKVNALPGDDSYTLSVAVGDVDGDGHPDLLFGNYGEPNQLLLNRGDGTFNEAAAMILSDAFNTIALAFADFNNDGRLDIVIGNAGQTKNQLLLFSDCPKGGAPLHGSSWCFPCPSFMGRSTVVGTPVCRECPPDHTQDSNDDEQCSSEACVSFQERKLGQDTCSPCQDGFFYNSSIIRSESDHLTFFHDRCAPCEEGTFYSKALHATAVDQCNYCPPRLSSPPGSPTCSYCNDDHMLNPTFKGASLETFVDASNEETCLKCPPSAKCDSNTTLETLGVPPTYWRGSLHTSVLYSCDGGSSTRNKLTERCSGTSTTFVVTSPDDYCADGYKGPLCKLCEGEDQYFDDSDGKCVDCEKSSLLALNITAIALALLLCYFVIRFCTRQFQSLRSRGFQTKVKILISFYQVAATFQGVYGMHLHEDVAGIFNFISCLMRLRFFEVFLISAECVGSKEVQLFFIILAPICVIILAGAWFFIVALVKHGNWKNQFLNVVLVTVYLVLPGVCNNIFSIMQCEHFVTRDDPNESSSFLKDDFSIECDKSNPDYSSLLLIFFVSLILWPILVNILWIYLIARIWRPVRTNRITPLAYACRFLWRDYESSMIFWDIIDMLRKIILTGVIACIDMRASTNVVRLIIAGVISFVYVVFLAMSRPYKRGDDHYLAVVSNILLTCCFLMGIILNICDDGYDCKEMIGFGSEYTASVIVVVLTLSTLVISIFLFLGLVFLTISHPVLRLKSGEKPNLALDTKSKCEFHAFFSHKWLDGKPKHHAIVRKMQLIAMPGMRIWLDVDDIANSDGNLEQAVAESFVFLVFVSKGYFASKNCRREIYTAMRLEKPVIVIYEGNKSALESLMNECRRYCSTDNDTLSKILENLEKNSIPWVDENIFSAKALNIICTKFLSNLPDYQANPDKLEDGVLVPGELGIVRLTSAVNLIVCRSNKGSSKVVNEILSQAGFYSRNIIVSPPIANGSEFDISTQEEMHNVLILYLNKDVFEQDAEELTGVLKHAIDKEIEIILLHELDPEREGCEFEKIYHQTPIELLEEPYNIYSKMAVSLHGYDDYRELGLKRVLCKLGGEEVSEGMCATFAKSLRDSFIISQV